MCRCLSTEPRTHLTPSHPSSYLCRTRPQSCWLMRSEDATPCLVYCGDGTEKVDHCNGRGTCSATGGALLGDRTHSFAPYSTCPTLRRAGMG